MTILKKRVNIPNVARNCNNYVTICNKNELNGHTIVKKACWKIVTKLGGELNLPTIYCFNSGHNRFLDDILLFSILDESYIAKDMEYSEQNIKTVFANKDISKGIIVFINPGQENDEILAKLRDVIGLESWSYLERLNACDVYYLK